MDAKKIKKDFPILSQKVHEKSLVYLDSAATSQKPLSVIEALSDYYKTLNANIHRGIYYLSEQSTEKFERVRQQVADFIGAPEARTIIFTRNTSESINLVAQAWGRKNLSEGDEILLTEMEHHSNIVPWQLIANEKGVVIRYIPITEEGTLDFSQIDRLLSDKTKIVAVAHVSNVLGTINALDELIEKAHQAGALVVVDGAQAVPHLKVDVGRLDCDFYAFSANKMLGPTGVGVLYGKAELLEAMPPFLGGGEMIMEVHPQYATWKELPWKFEAGTTNFADVIAFSKSMEYLEKIGFEAIREHEKLLSAYALKRLKELGNIRIFGPMDVEKRCGVISFSMAEVHPHDVGTVLDQEGVAIRAGHHCAQILMRKLNVPATARASFYIYNTKEDVDRLIAALEKARGYFRRGR